MKLPLSRSVTATVAAAAAVLTLGFGPQHAGAGGPTHAPGKDAPCMHGGAMHGPGMRGPDMTGMLESRIEKLGLDQTTRDAVYAIIDGSKGTVRETKAELQEQHEAMRKLLEQETPDETAVLTQADRIGSLMTELHKQELRTLLAVRAQLTPEQRKALRPPDGGPHHGCYGHGDGKEAEG